MSLSIGVGTMGYYMCGNVRRNMPSSSILYVNDISRSACERVVKDFSHFGRIEIAETARDVASSCSLLFSIVPDNQAVETVYLHPTNGVIAATEDENRLILECSTISVHVTRDVGNKIIESRRGIFVDAPVSGGIRLAEAGTLAMLIGHPELTDGDQVGKRISRAVSWIGAVDKTIFCGELGTGGIAKIANNYIAMNTIVTVSEAMAFGIQNGIDGNVLHKAIRSPSGNNWILNNKQPAPGILADAPSSNGFSMRFKPGSSCKDLSLGLEIAKLAGTASSMGDAAYKVFEHAHQDPRTTVSTTLAVCASYGRFLG